MEVMGTAKAYYQQIRDDWDQERSRKILEIDAVGPSDPRNCDSLFSENMQASFEASRALNASSATRDVIESEDEEVVLLDDNHEVLDVTLGEDTAVVESKRSGSKSAIPHSYELLLLLSFPRHFLFQESNAVFVISGWIRSLFRRSKKISLWPFSRL